MNKLDFINWILKKAAEGQTAVTNATVKPLPTPKMAPIPKLKAPQMMPQQLDDKHILRTQKGTPQPGVFNIQNNEPSVSPAPAAAFEPINPRLKL